MEETTYPYSNSHNNGRAGLDREDGTQLREEAPAVSNGPQQQLAQQKKERLHHPKQPQQRFHHQIAGQEEEEEEEEEERQQPRIVKPGWPPGEQQKPIGSPSPPPTLLSDDAGAVKGSPEEEQEYNKEAEKRRKGQRQEQEGWREQEAAPKPMPQVEGGERGGGGTAGLNVWEPCAIPASDAGPAVECTLPSSLTLLGDLSSVLSLDTWNSRLTEDERSRLRVFLPGKSVEQKEDTLKCLLEGENFFFGNPVATFARDLMNGFYHREVARYRDKVIKLQKKKHQIDLMSYRGRQLQTVMAWKEAAGLIAPGSAESQVLENPPGLIYSTVDPSTENGGWESVPASRKHKLQEEERSTEEADKKKKKRRKDKKKKERTEKRQHKGGEEKTPSALKKVASKNGSKAMELDEDQEEEDHIPERNKKGSKKSGHIRAGATKEIKWKNSEKEAPSTSVAAASSISTPIFVFFGKLREAFQACGNFATLDDLVEKLKALDDVDSDLLPHYSLRKFVQLALDFLLEPPPPTAPFALGSASTISSSAGSSGSISPSKDTLPIIKYEQGRQAWRWVAQDCQSVFNKLQSIEQLFYFATSRNLIDDKTGKLSLAMVKQHKCTNTIELSSPQTTADYRLQETKRYNNPEQAFTYVTNGMKAVVGPVKHTGSANRGPSNKPREHFLLKTKRPAYINLLGLVRDAAARLPGGVGTRPDVAILLKDSQWVEEVPNERLNTVVSGALDRLHSQNDPCVRFDPDQKLWIYLHRLRKESDFEVQPFPKSKSRRASHAAPPSPAARSSQQITSPPEKQAADEPPSPPSSQTVLSPPPSPDSSDSSPPSSPLQSTMSTNKSSNISTNSASSTSLPSISSSSSSFTSSFSTNSHSLTLPSISTSSFPLNLHLMPSSSTSGPHFPSSSMSFRPFHLPAQLTGSPYMHYSTVPPPAPLPPLHPHPATYSLHHSSYTTLPSPFSPFYSASASSSTSTTNAQLPRLHMPQNWGNGPNY